MTSSSFTDDVTYIFPDRNLQKLNGTDDVISKNVVPSDENDDVTDDVVEKTSPSAAYAIVPLVVFILILGI